MAGLQERPSDQDNDPAFLRSWAGPLLGPHGPLWAAPLWAGPLWAPLGPYGLGPYEPCPYGALWALVSQALMSAWVVLKE